MVGELGVSPIQVVFISGPGMCVTALFGQRRPRSERDVSFFFTNGALM